MIEHVNGATHRLAVPEPLRLTPPQKPSRWARMARTARMKPQEPPLTASAAEADLATKN